MVWSTLFAVYVCVCVCVYSLDIASDLYSLGTCNCQNHLVEHELCVVSMYCDHCE